MPVKSFDPDNRPDTPPPSLSLSEVASEFGDPIKDPGAVPDQNTGHKMSEFYRDGGYVPSNSPSGEPGPFVTEVLRVPNIYPETIIINEREGGGIVPDQIITPSLNGDPFYVRVKYANVSLPGWPNNGELLFQWGTGVIINLTGLNFSEVLLTRPEYQGFVYALAMGVIHDHTTPDGIKYQYHQIMRRPVAVGEEINEQVPTTGPISFRNLYSSTQAISRTVTIPAFSTTNLSREKGIEEGGTEGPVFGIGTNGVWPQGFEPNAVLKRVSFDIGFNAKITVTANANAVPISVKGGGIVSGERQGPRSSQRLDIRYPGYRIISPSGGAVLATNNAGGSIGSNNNSVFPTPGLRLTSTIATSSVDNLTERGTYYLEFTAQVRHENHGPRNLTASLDWTTPEFNIKIETT